MGNGTSVLNKSNEEFHARRQSQNNFAYYDQKMKNFDISEPRRRKKYSKVYESNDNIENLESR
jgi:hypothetical protein